MAFHEVRFPDNISRGARGGPERRTQIVELASGDEERNASWTGETGRVNAIVERHAEELGLAPDDTLVYACGHPGMIEDVKKRMIPRGFKVEAGTHTVRVVHEHCPGGRHRFGDRRNRYGEGVRRARASRAL